MIQEHVGAPSRRHEERAFGTPNTGEEALVKGRILVVENEPFLRESLATLFEESGYEVSLAEDGRVALTRLNTEPLPDLIVLDLGMPEMDGWAFRAFQSSAPRLAAIPVLVVSGSDSLSEATISAQGYLRKPFDAREIIFAVEQTLLVGQNERDLVVELDRLAQVVGHEINNPLTVVMLGLRLALEELGSSTSSIGAGDAEGGSDGTLVTLKAQLASVMELVRESEAGGARIQQHVKELRQRGRLLQPSSAARIFNARASGAKGF
jgi:CheY-like chemotaxis protein